MFIITLALAFLLATSSTTYSAADASSVVINGTKSIIQSVVASAEEGEKAGSNEVPYPRETFTIPAAPTTQAPMETIPSLGTLVPPGESVPPTMAPSRQPPPPEINTLAPMAPSWAPLPTQEPTAPPTPVPNYATHHFTINNQCRETIWVATLSNPGFPTIANGGFAMHRDEEPKLIKVPVGWQGRIWARAACNFTAEGVCDPPYKPCCASGSCLQADGRFGIHCAHAGLPPNSLIEMSLDNPSPVGPYDVYDISLVDGWSVPVSIEPVNGSYNPEPDAGNPSPWCEYSGCYAVPECPDHLTVEGTTVSCWSPCQAAVNAGLSAEETEKVCCVCTLNQPTCDCAATTDRYSSSYGCCRGGFGCTPYHNPPYPQDTVCNPWSNNTNRAWPQSDLKYISTINNVCRKVYTWQFDDKAATFQCRRTGGLVDYGVTFVTMYR